MALPAGTRFGPYQIVNALGAGGMGEVYRARDTKLNRDVAIKVLPEAVAANPDRLARFEREAQSLAALNHPNIAQIYGLERAGHTPAIVMELVEGDDLSSLTGVRGLQTPGVAGAKAPALHLNEALKIARQITEALAAAHDAGIVHRDLKPANIKVKVDGTVKVLDFGLAKALASEAANATVDAANSPTITTPAMTEAGIVLGTAAYMSPEQARGRIVDKRADVWAFGVVLFELLTGTRPFQGSDVSETMARVLMSEPDWTALPQLTPWRIRELVRHCLAKSPRQRLHDIADARLQLEDALGGVPEAQPIIVTSAPATRRERLAWAAAVVVLAVALVALGGRTYFGRVPQAPVSISRVLIGVAPADQLQASTPMEASGEGRPSRTTMALSPDGRSLVFSAARGNAQQLYIRALDRLEAVPLAGTEGGDSPFFSPDGKWIGFWAQDALRKVSISGGPATAICDTAAVFGASWGLTDAIVYARMSGGLWLIPSGGGTPQALTTLDAKSGEFSHRLPQFLPDGQAVLFTAVSHFLPDWREARLSVVSLDNGQRRDLGQGADARYASSGHLVFMRSGTLVAAPFDPGKRELTGASLTVLDDVMQAANMTSSSTETGAGQFSFSASGSLVYLPGGIFPDREMAIISVDRGGTGLRPLPVPPRPYYALLLSPDQTQLLVWTQGVDRNLWTYDIGRGTLTRLITAGRNSRAIWTPNGKRVAFAGSSAGADNLFWMPADGSGPAERLTTSTNTQMPSSWSLHGQTLAFVENTATSSYDVMAMSVDGDRQPKPILQTRFAETYPEFSRDDRYLAYTSNESGRDEVYVQPYPGPGPRKQVSNEGGSAPAWSRDGRELFYQMRTGLGIRMMVVQITTAPSFTAGAPRALFEGPYATQGLTRGYDVTADGQRFYFTQVKPRPPVRATQMILVQNWFEELKAKLPTGR